MTLARTAAVAALLLTSAEMLQPQERAVRDSLDVVRAEFVRGYNDGNAAALERLYVSDAVRMVYDAPAQRGKAEIVQALRRSFANRRADVQLALRPEEIQLAGDFALERGSYHEVWIPRNGLPPFIEDGKYVTVSRRIGEAWKYAWSIFNRDNAPPVRAPLPAVPGALSGTTVVPASWQAWGEGLEMAMLHGDPAIADSSYTIALRLAAGRWIRPHWHPRAKQVYVVSGTLLFGHGEIFDTTKTTALQPGTIVAALGRHAHFEGARGQTVVLLSGIGPLRTTMIRELSTPAGSP